MAKHLALKDATSRSEYIFIQDSSLTTGAGKTGLVFNTASLVAYYVRPLGSATAITLATQTVTGAFSSGGFVEVDSTNMPGVYRLDVPNAAFATGVDKVVVMLKGAANMAPVLLEYQLVGFDPAALTWLTPTTAGRTLDVSAGGEAGLDWANIGSPTTAQNLSATNIDVDQVVASVSGAVGSVTGAVGSVTGAVGSVTGAVGSVTADVTLAAAEENAIADAVRARQLTEGYAADGVAPTLQQALFMIQQMLTEMSISGTTMTVKKIDGATTAATFTLDDATTPTSITRAT